MARPVLLILLLLAGLWWLSRQGERNTRSDASEPAGRRRAGQAGTPEPIERCDVCGVHAPRAGMIALPNGRYRCAEHASRTGRSDA